MSGETESLSLHGLVTWCSVRSPGAGEAGISGLVCHFPTGLKHKLQDCCPMLRGDNQLRPQPKAQEWAGWQPSVKEKGVWSRVGGSPTCPG